LVELKVAVDEQGTETAFNAIVAEFEKVDPTERNAVQIAVKTEIGSLEFASGSFNSVDLIFGPNKRELTSEVNKRLGFVKYLKWIGYFRMFNSALVVDFEKSEITPAELCEVSKAELDKHKDF
jgi:hypothetical protein